MKKLCLVPLILEAVRRFALEALMDCCTLVCKAWRKAISDMNTPSRRLRELIRSDPPRSLLWRGICFLTYNDSRKKGKQDGAAAVRHILSTRGGWQGVESRRKSRYCVRQNGKTWAVPLAAFSVNEPISAVSVTSREYRMLVHGSEKEKTAWFLKGERGDRSWKWSAVCRILDFTALMKQEADDESLVEQHEYIEIQNREESWYHPMVIPVPFEALAGWYAAWGWPAPKKKRPLDPAEQNWEALE